MYVRTHGREYPVVLLPLLLGSATVDTCCRHANTARGFYTLFHLRLLERCPSLHRLIAIHTRATTSMASLLYLLCPR